MQGSSHLRGEKRTKDINGVEWNSAKDLNNSSRQRMLWDSMYMTNCSFPTELYSWILLWEFRRGGNTLGNDGRERHYLNWALEVDWIWTEGDLVNLKRGCVVPFCIVF